MCTPPASEAARQGSNYAEGAILVVDVARATRDPAYAVIGAVPAGCNPVRLVISRTGDIAYVSARTDTSLTVIDTTKMSNGDDAILGNVPAGVFPRELRVTENQKTLLLTNFGSKTLAVFDIAQLPVESPRK